MKLYNVQGSTCWTLRTKWVEEGKGYREWLVPAAMLSGKVTAELESLATKLLCPGKIFKNAQGRECRSVESQSQCANAKATGQKLDDPALTAC